jgi:ABC-type nitrate/sulfonate/bicarbonate transport system substrate-binding protein
MRFRALLLAVAALGVSSSHAATAATPTPLVMSYVVANSIYWDIDAAIDEGFFRDENFAPEATIFQSSPQAVQLVISGGADMTAVEPEAMMAASLRGASDLGLIAESQKAPDWLLVVRPEIKNWADLKGKSFGFSALRVLEYFLTVQLMKQHGMGTDDWNALQVGVTPAKLAALEKGSIAGAVLFAPLALRATSDPAGLHAMAKYAALGDYPPTIFVVKRSWAAANDNGKRFSRAITRAHRWLWDPKNHDAALAVMEKYTKVDAATAEKVYRQYFIDEKLYTEDGAIDLAGLRLETSLLTANGEVPKDKALSPEALVIAKEQGGLWH